MKLKKSKVHLLVQERGEEETKECPKMSLKDKGESRRRRSKKKEKGEKENLLSNSQ